MKKKSTLFWRGRGGGGELFETHSGSEVCCPLYYWDHYNEPDVCVHHLDH